MQPATEVLQLPDPCAPNAGLVDAFLLARGLTREELVGQAPDDPAGIHGLVKAADLLQEAIETRRSIGIFGDYDVDGVSSTALLSRGISGLTEYSPVVTYVPNRAEGYGITAGGVRRLADQKVDLIVTCDNGTLALEAAAMAKHLGIPFIVTDHHPVPDPSKAVTTAAALVNPQYPGSVGAFQQLAGTGVAWFLLQELYRRFGVTLPEEWSSLVALATVADVVPLTGVNRQLVRDGLANLRRLPGLRALLDTARVQAPGTGDISFELAPRLNAAGRMASPRLALDLLLTDDDFQARELAGECDGLNAKRKQAQKEATLRAGVTADLAPDEARALVIFSTKIGPGIAGLVAGRLADQFGVPTVVGSINRSTGMISGSARSGSSGVVCHALLAAAGDAMLNSGGHAAAAGFKMRVATAKTARARILEAALTMSAGTTPQRVVTADVHLPRLPSIEELRELEELGPWGQQVPAPVLASSDVLVTSHRCPRGKYTEIELDDGVNRNCAFSFAPAPIEAGSIVTVVYQPDPRRGLRLASIGPSQLVNQVDPPAVVRAVPRAPRGTAVGF